MNALSFACVKKIVLVSCWLRSRGPLGSGHLVVIAKGLASCSDGLKICLLILLVTLLQEVLLLFHSMNLLLVHA